MSAIGIICRLAGIRPKLYCKINMDCGYYKDCENYFMLTEMTY